MMKDITSDTVEVGKSETPKSDGPPKPLFPSKAESKADARADTPPKAEKPPRERKPISLRMPRETLGIFEIVGHAIAWLGVILVVYGMVSTLTSEVWMPLERFILPIAATLVLVAIGLNAAVVYALPENPGPASPVSRYVTAPAVILLCAAGLFLVWHQGLPVAVILGFAVLGLAWSLLRSLPRRPSAW